MSHLSDDLPDYTRRIVYDVTLPELLLGRFNAWQIRNVDLLDPTVAACLPISIENDAIAYDAVNDVFKVRSESTDRPIYVDLRTIAGYTLSPGDWTTLFNYLTRIPTDPAKESGKLTDINTLLNTRIPTDPAKESGKLTDLYTLLNTRIPTDPAKESGKLTDLYTLLNTRIPTDPAKESGKLTDLYTLLNTRIPTDPAKESGKLNDLAGIAFMLRATTPITYNKTMTLADTEYSQELPANTKKFQITTRDRSAFRLAWVTGKVATPTEPYESYAAGDVYYEDGLNLSATTVYFASDDAGKVMEIHVWT